MQDADEVTGVDSAALDNDRGGNCKTGRWRTGKRCIGKTADCNADDEVNDKWCVQTCLERVFGLSRWTQAQLLIVGRLNGLTLNYCGHRFCCWVWCQWHSVGLRLSCYVRTITPLLYTHCRLTVYVIKGLCHTVVYVAANFQSVIFQSAKFQSYICSL